MFVIGITTQCLSHTDNKDAKSSTMHVMLSTLFYLFYVIKTKLCTMISIIMSIIYCNNISFVRACDSRSGMH